MNDPRFWWAVGVAAIGFAGKIAVDWWRSEEHERRIRALETWRQEHGEKFANLLGKLGEGGK